MKKLIISLLIGALASFGLTLTTGSPASACSAYSGCVATQAKAKVKHAEAGKPATVKAKVSAVGGNVKPKGVVKFVITGPNGRQYFYKGRLKNGAVSIKTFKLAPGTYKVTISYVPKKGSVFNASRSTTTVVVS